MADKNSSTYLILAIAAAGLIIAGAILYVSVAPGGQTIIPVPAALQPFSEQVLIPETMQDCAKGDRCIVVDTTCSFCCKYTPINAIHEQAFNQMFDKNCQAYKGQMCTCFDLSSYPSCVNGKCVMVKFEEQKP